MSTLNDIIEKRNKVNQAILLYIQAIENTEATNIKKSKQNENKSLTIERKNGIM